MRKHLLACAAAAAMLAVSGAENLVNVSWGDSIMIGTGVSKLDTPEKIRTSMRSWLDHYDGKTILWRISSEYLKRYYRRQPTKTQKEYDAKVDAVAARFDPVKVVREESRKNGQQFLLYGTFLDHGCPHTLLYHDTIPFPWQDEVTIAHPEYQERDLAGNYHYGVLDLSNPDARKFIIKRLVDFVNEYDADGLYLCGRTHSLPAIHGDQFGFGPEVVREYRKRYGIDITADKRFDYRAKEYAPQAPEVIAWRKLRGEYLTQFIREMRQALGNKVFYIGLPRGTTLQCPFGNLFVDKETMVKEHLVDGMILGVVSGRFLYPRRKTPHKDLGFLESDDDNWNVPPLAEEIGGLQKLAGGKVKFFYSGNFQRRPPIAGDGMMIGSPNCRPAPYIIDSPELYSKSLTVEAFVKLADSHGAFSEAPRIVSKYSHNGVEQRGWELNISNKKMPVFRTMLVAADGRISDHHLTSGKAVVPGRWHHIAAVLDADKGEKRLYLDGELVGSWKVPEGFALNRNPGIDIAIGCYNFSIQELRGQIDELRIVSKADFRGVPRKPYTGKEPGTLMLFHFDGGSGKADAAAPGVVSKFIGEPEFSPGVFGKALDISRAD